MFEFYLYLEKRCVRTSSCLYYLYSAGAVALDMLVPKFDVKLPVGPGSISVPVWLLSIGCSNANAGARIPPNVVMDTITPINAKIFKILIEL